MTGDFQNLTSTQSLTVANCIIRGNAAVGPRGGIASRRTNVLFADSFFIGKLSGTEGGAVWGQDSLTSARGCEFRENKAVLSGGAMHQESLASSDSVLPDLEPSDLFEQATFMNRVQFQTWVGATVATAKQIHRECQRSSGGAIATFFDNMSIEASEFSGNQALGTGGAALYQGGFNTVNIINSAFHTNESRGDSAISSLTHCNTYIVNC